MWYLTCVIFLMSMLCLTLINYTLAEDDGINPNGSTYRHRNVKHRRRYASNVETNYSTESPQSATPYGITEVTRLRSPGPIDASGLSRISERLSALTALDEQQLKRLENLEYKLTKLEVQSTDKLELVRNELRDISRRWQQQEWQSSRTDSTLDALRTDVAFLRQIAEIRPQNPGVGDVGQINQDIVNDLQSLRAEVATLRKEALATKTELYKIRANVTKIAGLTTDMFRDSKNYITKQYFNSAMQSLKQSFRHYDMAMKATYRDAANTRSSLEGGAADVPVDCWQIFKSGLGNISGPYRIQPISAERPLFAYCDQERWGGGWTVLQTRFDGSTDFYRPYQDYVHGFGNVAGEHWLGLETAHLLTSNGLYELLIDLQDFDEVWTYAHYKSFSIGPEAQSYPINVLGAYFGDAGDSFAYQAGHKFSAHDLDNDNWPEGSCAQAHHGAWWYHACEQSNLNGLYLSGPVPEDVSNQGMYWYEFHGPSYSLKASRMMIRPAGARTDFTDKAAIKPKTKSDAAQPSSLSSSLSDFE